jgi:PTS system nitrogen regulatory IIA component
MLLTVRDAAKLLGKPEQQLYRWVDDGDIPFHKVNDQIRFHRAELLEWATAKKIPVAVEIFHDDADSARELPSLSRALAAGGVHFDVPGDDRASVLSAVIERMPLHEAADREFLLDVLMAREAMGSTGIGDGIAIPHVRNPVVLDGVEPLVTLCFLKKPVEYGAIDGNPVHTIFSLATPTIRGHLQLLAKLSWAMHDQRFRDAVLRRAKADEILAEARRVEATFPQGAEPA